jgi:putative transposase
VHDYDSGSLSFSLLSLDVRSRASLELGLIVMRHQLIVLRRPMPPSPVLNRSFVQVGLYRAPPQLLDTLILVKPKTVIGWHRNAFPGHGDHAIS